jgi:monoamine oxidase
MRYLVSIVIVAFSLLSCGKKYIESADTVIVIGAGISGLSAAKELKDNGVKHVIVLEASDKPGGRMTTDRSLGFAFDEGASWIHKSIGNPITDLAIEAGTTTFLTDDDNVVVYDKDGAAYAAELYDEEDEAFEEAIIKVQKAGTNDQSFETVYHSLYPDKANDNLWKFMVSSYVEFDLGGDISNLSSNEFYDDKEHKGVDIIVTNGFDNITNYFAEGLDIRYNERVAKVDYTDESKVVVTSTSGTFECAAVVVTVPLGVLKSGNFIFSPELPDEKKDAMEDLAMGTVNKYVFVWDTAFWDIDLQYIGYAPETKGAFNTFLNIKKYSNYNALMTFTFGEYSRTAEDLTDAEIIELVMNNLKAIYGDNIPDSINMLRTKWNANENALGCYSYVQQGGDSDAYNILAEPIDDRVYFAGEHTSFDYRATVHGAYVSGVVAADEVLKWFKK